MRIIKPIIVFSFLIVILVISVDLAFSQDDEMLGKMAADEELQQELKWLKAETYVITASKVMENIKKAPASVTVITDKQIRQMGARNLADVLRAVPGFNALSFWSGGYLFDVRGGSRFPSYDILIMINSHPINDVTNGSATWVHDTLIIDNIQRIEFIRGPGSALYGANAFHGVINVITKKAENIDGFELIARGGSWDTQQYNLLYGKNFSELEVAFNFNYFKTHGFRAFIEEDFQSWLDQQWEPYGFPPASLAPGRTNGDDEKYDVALNLKFKGFTFDGRYVDREKVQPFGFLGVLTDDSNQSMEDYYLNLSYEIAIMEGLDISGKVYRNHFEYFNDFKVFPPGYTGLTPNPTPPPPTIPATWEEGCLIQGSGKASRTGIEIQATYNMSDSNTIVAGATYEEQKWYDNNLSGNYLPLNARVSVKFPSVQDWPDNRQMETGRRNFKAVFLEDLWDITDDIRLTTGARYDHYSDFGGHFSPRVGLTWEYIKGYDIKLLYGHAFRAPTPNEIYFRDPALGSELDPETIDTFEASLGADFTSSFSGRATFYHKEEKDVIGNARSIYYANLYNRRAQGFEFEANYDFGRGTYISGYYDYLSKKSLPLYARHLAHLMVNIRLSRYLNFNADCNYWDGMNRESGDTRDDPSSLTLVNATLIAKKFLKSYEGLELRCSVYNLFDEDWRRPTPASTNRDTGNPAPPWIPNDWPMPGINFLFDIRYKF